MQNGYPVFFFNGASMLKALFVSAVLMMAVAAPAAAEKINFKITDSAGAPISGAVVMSAAKGKPATGAYLMKQSDLTFDPYILVVPVGAEVSFPNLDRVRHHVYSFSKGNRFELKLYGKEDQRSVTFDSPGIVAIGCNIHDEMVGYIRVVESAAFGKTGPDGQLTLDMPPGKVTVWHPDAMGKEVSVDVPSASASPVGVTLKMKPKAHAH